MEIRSILVLSLACIATAHGQERVRHALGEFEMAASATGVLIAAPHGTFDANTGAIALDAARQAGAGHLVAWRFTPNKVRINVNRPTEGAFLGCKEEQRSERAQSVYDAYTGLVAKAGGDKPLRLYVEVHVNSNPKTAQNVEVATTGVSAAEARKIKEAFPGLLAKARASAPAFPEVGLLIEPVDRIVYTAGCAKRIGIFSRDFAPRGVHFEFPRSAREGEAIKGAALIVAEIARTLASATARVKLQGIGEYDYVPPVKPK